MKNTGPFFSSSRFLNENVREFSFEFSFVPNRDTSWITQQKQTQNLVGDFIMTTLKPVFLATAIALTGAGTPAVAESLFESFINTTPAGLVSSSSDRPGDFSSFWEATKTGIGAMMSRGNSEFIIPTYTIHPAYDWPDYREENAIPAGMGLGRVLIDERGNERTLFLVSFVDSNYNLEPMIGYQWVARYPLANSGLHVGAGYVMGITMRDDFGWYPVPAPLPVAKIGTDTVSFYGTFIPFTNVLFFYSIITIDDAKRRDAPLPVASAWSSAENVLYGGWGWQYIDNAEEASRHGVENDDS